MIIEAPFTATKEEDVPKKPAAILRQENLDSTVLLCLFDREPGSEDFKQLIFRQPPHQQSFAAAYRLTPECINLKFKRVYTGPTTDPPIDKKLTLEPKPINPIPSDSATAPFIWGPNNSIRTLKFPDYAKLAYNTLTEQFKQGFDKSIQKAPTSALVGIQLNNPMLFLEIRDKARPSLPPAMGLRTLLMSYPTRPDALPAAHAPRAILARTMFDMDAHLPSLASRLRTSNDDNVPPPAPRLIPSLTNAEFTRITTPNPGGLSALRASTRALGSSPAKYPTISYACFAFGTYARESKTVPMWENPPALRQDLIFSIIIDHKSVADFHLHELQILIRLGSMTGPRKTLALKYDGPGARMLSNLRFNVIPVTGDDGNLLIRLLPRSTLGQGVPMTLFTDVSFVLNGVVVNRYKDSRLDTKGTYTVYTVVTEKYGNRGDQVISDETSNDPFVIVMRKPKGNEYDQES